MDYDDPNFLQDLRDALRNIQDGGHRRQPRRGTPSSIIDEFKVTELPEFLGGTDPEIYLEWERKIDRMFDFKDLDDEKRCKYAILKLGKSASLWYDGLKTKRSREGKGKIESWESLKRKLRKRYVPTTHKLTLYKKIANLVQGKLSVSEYIDEFEGLALMGDVEENEEQKMARFIRGLNRHIANTVDLCPYADFDTLCGLCLKVEAQGKTRYGGDGESSRGNVWTRPDFTSKSGASNSNPTASLRAPTMVAPNPSPKNSNAPKETSLSKVRCFKCQGFGHYQNACPNRRIVTLREAVSIRDELWVEEEQLGEIFNLNETEHEEEEVENYDAPIYDTALVLRALQTKTTPIDAEQRDQLFHTKCQVKDKWCSLIIDGGSCTNVASKEMVSKLGLVTMAHPRPYALHWLDDGSNVKVSRQVRIGLTMGPYNDTS